MGVSAKSPQLRPTLRNSMDWTLPGSSVPGILQARMLEWTDVPPPGGLPHPGIQSLSSPILAGGFFTSSTPWEAPGL